MHDTYISNQKFESIGILVFRDATKTWKKSYKKYTKTMPRLMPKSCNQFHKKN